MNVDVFTSGLGRQSKARTQHQEDTAVLIFEVDGNKIAMFGPGTAKEAFAKMAEIFNEAHPKPASE